MKQRALHSREANATQNVQNAETAQSAVNKVRAHLAQKGLDALVLTDVSDIRWLTGAAHTFDTEPAHVAFITKDKLWLHSDSRYYEALRANMAQRDAWVLDKDPISCAQWAATRIAKEAPAMCALQSSVTLAFFDELQAHLQAADVQMPRFVHLDQDLRDLRAIKTPAELASLQKAQDITDEAFRHITQFIRPGMTEKAIRAELDHFILAHGGDALSFETIVAAGANAANPHARASDYQVQKGDLVVIDFGATYNDYHADMTRTLSIGQPTDEQRVVYDVVQRAHETAARALVPGVTGKEIHALAAAVIDEAGYGAFFGHGLGHGVGLEIHENPNLNMRAEDPLEEGAVVTVEPGIYLPGRFGIRLEDTGVVGLCGFQPFTALNHALSVIS